MRAKNTFEAFPIMDEKSLHKVQIMFIQPACQVVCPFTIVLISFRRKKNEFHKYIRLLFHHIVRCVWYAVLRETIIKCWLWLFFLLIVVNGQKFKSHDVV